jgi:hypothetical protein
MAIIPGIEIDAQVSIGIVRPGDKLLIAVAGPLDMGERDEVREEAERWLPGVEGVVIRADALVVYRS